jgi:hypothetical protein
MDVSGRTAVVVGLGRSGVAAASLLLDRGARVVAADALLREKASPAALALGGGLGMLAIFTKNELLSILLGGIFFIETASVITQVVSFKLTGKRVFLMAPIHHHYEKKGWAEPKIIVRFWIISILLALVSLASMKLR